jgi:hypothetical protein
MKDGPQILEARRDARHTAQHEVALGSTVTGMARRFTYEHTWHGGMGLLRARLE